MRTETLTIIIRPLGCNVKPKTFGEAMKIIERSLVEEKTEGRFDLVLSSGDIDIPYEYQVSWFWFLR